jgi:3-dehydroquinate synthase
MSVVHVDLAGHGYDVIIEPGLIARAGPLIAARLKRPQSWIITDAHVDALHGDALRTSLSAAGVAHDTLVLTPGEATKSWAGLEQLAEWLIARGVERSDHIIALGGGVIGDLVGLAASLVKRGCAFIQIPTTLLAQVDSSVGGKTAINGAGGKNMIGAFHQPALVLIDPEVLATLPPRDLRAGYAEVVKYGLIGDADFFDWCEANHAALLGGDPAARARAIEVSVAAKARIVAADERETHDVRALLNLGHTFGHALEAETGFSDTLLHGEAVAAGCAIAFAFSAARGLCSPDDAARVAAHLAAAGLPHDLASAGVNASGATLAAHMAHDKKGRGGRIPFILARGIGQAFVDDSVELAEVAAFLDQLRGGN